jgi:hypothetical protein
MRLMVSVRWDCITIVAEFVKAWNTYVAGPIHDNIDDPTKIIYYNTKIIRFGLKKDKGGVLIGLIVDSAILIVRFQ